FSDNNGSVLNTVQASNLFASISVYLDDGDQVFNPGVDSVVGTVNELMLSPVGAAQKVPLSGVQVPATGSARLFVEALLTPDAAAQTPNQFQVKLQRPQSSDALAGGVLSLECAMNAQSGVLTVRPGVAFF
ncbi:MAG: hypothetical protein IH987_11460, partial [Planctomycetes bacterium]|nr:hypothetical protein [Planctomycetota bacterium]